MSENNKESEYWNEEGGERWVENIERLESMLSGLSAHLIAATRASLGERVLDIGCGGGVTSAAIAELVGAEGNVIGLDISEVILNVARKRFSDRQNLSFLTADAGNHAYEPESFDLVTSRFGVMFFPEPKSAFANIGASVRPGGRIVFMCWRDVKENPWMGIPVAAAFSVLPAPDKSDPDAPGPFSLSDPEKIKRLLGDAGFSQINLSAVDDAVNLGDLDAALNFLTKLGPAAEPLRQASESDRKLAMEAMRKAMTPHATPSGVHFTGAVWIVEAER